MPCFCYCWEDTIFWETYHIIHIQASLYAPMIESWAVIRFPELPCKATNMTAPLSTEGIETTAPDSFLKLYLIKSFVKSAPAKMSAPPLLLRNKYECHGINLLWYEECSGTYMIHIIWLLHFRLREKILLIRIPLFQNTTQFLFRSDLDGALIFVPGSYDFVLFLGYLRYI